MNRRIATIMACLLLVCGTVAAATWWYLTSPEFLMEAFLGCGGPDNKDLVSSKDQPYWDEWEKGQNEATSDLELARSACLETRELVSIELSGTSGVAEFKVRMPKLEWEELTEFPATATRSEKLAILRERAQRAKGFTEDTEKVFLRFDGLGWKVFLDLEPRVLASRQLDSADRERRNLKWDSATAMYESISADNSLPEYARELAGEYRVSVIAEKACFLAVRRFVKFPDAADYKLRGSSSKKAGPVNVTAIINAPNAFGLKSRIAATCEVTFQDGEPNAYVDVFLVHSTGGVINEKRIEVKL